MRNSLLYLGIMMIGLLNLKCRDKYEEEILVGIIWDKNVYLEIKNAAGVDMLDPNSPNSFKRFKVYYLVNGIKEFYYDPWMDAPGGYIIQKFPNESFYQLQIFINGPTHESRNDHEWVTYLEFEDGSTDTISASFGVRPGNISVEKATYNGRPMWDTSLTYAKEPFELIKP
ncbi:hypothetical protein [Dyadobacter aurulentus]|uniref:hypothetical protein n=1 Tax=Dyadobacter sp. UC 10 TaxID=2605428 RepID=UPI0011F17283|nr:hypothetical protein [Dyadobacter sp. UC 10]KAA0992591.1 hypothetical protein FXO21_21660 [Dyadobacter sp. UC 10]